MRYEKLKEIVVASFAQTEKVAEYVAQLLRTGDSVCLDGDLGAGKTTFTKALATALGVSAQDVSSPSFAIMKEYHGKEVVIQHFDLYRLDSPAQLDAIGYLEMLENDCINVIEWSELFPEYLPHDYIGVDIKYINDTTRMFRIFGVGAYADIVEEGLEHVDFGN